MKLINQSWSFDEPIDGMTILKKIERAGRTCYKSEDKITDTSALAFCKSLIKRGHFAMLDHAHITVKAITDRGVTHEIVRHRIAAYAQESTRYCNYTKLGIRFIKPVDFELTDDDIRLLDIIETHYNIRIAQGLLPQQARYFLPSGLKTEITMTYDITEWRHFFTLRCPSPPAHPQMGALARSMLAKFDQTIPVLFEDLAQKYLKEVISHV
jgi:thymidylate synthase (FAD)